MDPVEPSKMDGKTHRVGDGSERINRCYSLTVSDYLRCSFAQFELITHFLDF